ncbi:hypothetical protein, partial [Proteus mirabilis]|uniref:hypothetical protein n=1 Tax=Proteus mirabilis TaxID=584 RepID=UPI001954A710
GVASSIALAMGSGFFQGLSILGYCFFPVVLGSLLSLFVFFKPVQILIQSAMLVWSIYCALE